MANNEDIDFGQVSEALNDKADRDFKNIEEDASVPYHIEQMEEEVENRIAGDNALQEQIDAIVSKQELADIVGTYADLQNYDTSGLANNSIIEVLQDETHDGAVSYYKYSTSTHSFIYIGSTAASYTKEEADGRFAHLSGNETIAGTKTFSTVPLVGTATTGDNSTKAASTAFVQTAISTAGNNYVHLTGNETISGTKTFNNTIYKTSTIDHTSTSGEIEVNSLGVYDKQNRGISGYNTTRSSTTNTNRQRICNFNVGSTGYWYDLRANLRDDGHGFVSTAKGSNVIDNSTTYVTNSTGTSIIPTMGWVNNPETSTNVVHRSGNETISGDKTFSGTVTATTQETTDNSTKVATTAFVKSAISSNDQGVVHIEGVESITGTKTFTQEIKRTGAFSGNSTYGWYLTDTNSKGYIGNIGYYANSKIFNRLISKNSTSDKDAYIDVKSNDDGTSEFQMGGSATNTNMNESNSTSSTLIAAVGWVNDPTKSTNVVHRSGNETVGGTKTFTAAPIIKASEPTIRIQDSVDEKGTAPATTQYQWFGAIYDKNGIDQSNKMAQIYHTMYTGGNTDLHIQLFKPTASSTDVATDIVLKSSGAFEIPTPTEDTTTSVQAATVGWVKGKIPTNNNQLTNGAGYITSAALTPYALDSSISTVGKSNDYEDLDNKPTIPTVNNAKLTIQKNSSKVAEFTANASTDVTCNITVPTQPSDIGAAASSHNHVSSEISDLSTTISTAISNKADKATTISGYGITDAYTKTEIDGKISSVYKPAGSVAYASLPTPGSTNLGNVYNVTDAFTTDNRFIEGSGKTYPAGTNVVIIQSSSSYYFDVLTGMVDLSDYVPTSRKINNKTLTGDITLSASDIGAQPSGDYVTTSRKVNGHTLTSDVTVTKSDVGLGNVDNTADANKSVASAATLTTARTIDGVDFDGSKNITRFCVCNTAAGTVAKTATCDGFKLETGAIVFVKFTNTNTVDNPTLNINSTGDKLIKYRNGTFNKGYVAANRIYPFVYDGTYWQWVGDLDTSNNTQIRYNGNLKANTAINASTIIVGTKDGYRSVAADVSFDISYPIMWANKAISAGSTGTENYEAITGINVNTAVGNSSWTGTQYSVYYLVGTLNGSTFTISSPVGTTTVPTTDDGKCYIPLGYMYNTTQGSFYPLNKIFAYKNGKFQEVTTSVAWDDVTGKPNSFIPTAHNQASNTINAMTGYSKPSSTSAIAATDTLNTAVGKLEKAIDLLPVDSSVVHKTGDETIEGTKTFSNEIITGAGKGIQISGTEHDWRLRSTGSPAEGCALLLDSNLNKSAFSVNTTKIIIGSTNIEPHSVTPSTGDNSTRIATTAFVKGELSSYQTTITGAATTITSSNLTKNRAVISNGSGKIAVSSVTDTELGYLSGVTSSIQTQLNNKQASGNYVTSDIGVTHTASTAVGSSKKPVYIDSDGKATAISYTIEKSVPSNAVFTDTTYSDMVGADGTNAGSSGLVPAPAANANAKFLRGDGTWQTPTNTKNTAGSTDTSSKIFLIGAASQAANPQTYSHDTVFVDANGRLNSAAPASDANDTTVATTKWVNDRITAKSLPAQSGNAGKFLQTDGTNASWENVSSLPLLYRLYSETILNDGNYVRSNNNWLSGSLYSDAYNHLVNDFNGTATNKTYKTYKQSNVTYYGNITDRQGMLDGFSGTVSFAGFDSKNPTTSMELVVKVKSPTSIASNDSIIDRTTNYNGIVLRFYNASSVRYYISSNGTSWDVANNSSQSISSVTIATSTWYWFKTTWDGSTYKFYISVNGTTYVQFGSISSSNAPKMNAQSLGGNPLDNNDLGADGVIDLNECYLNIDGSRYWTGCDYYNVNYVEAADGHKIVTAANSSDVEGIYEKEGAADWYILDTTNTRFKLPKTLGRKLIKAYKDEISWYNLYSDGWVEQGSTTMLDYNHGQRTIPLLIEMEAAHYFVSATTKGFVANGVVVPCYRNLTTTSFELYGDYTSASDTLATAWEVKGYSNAAVDQYEYYYVGGALSGAGEVDCSEIIEELNYKLDADRIQFVSTLPANPVAGVYYFISEE